MSAELIKNAPEELHQMIANIFQLTSSGQNFPEVLRKGILVPLPKPPKKDMNVNVRSIILLSILRNILTLCMIERCWQRLKPHIPIEQAVYQLGRSTTEQVFCVKTLAEKVITTNDYTIFILMLDRSKAFDSIDRHKLLLYLSEILNVRETYILHLLLNDVVINVGNETGDNIKTNVGSCQGDCLSPIFFIFYLAKSIKPLQTSTERQNYNKPVWSELDWHIDHDNNHVNIDPKYSDDINFIRTYYPKINQLKREMPKMLKENNLAVNVSKTKEFTIQLEGNDTWEKCKILESHIDTVSDIERSHGLATASYTASLKTKLRVFNGYVGSIQQ